MTRRTKRPDAICNLTPTVENARAFFIYDPETGIVSRKSDMHPMGHRNEDGYLRFSFGGKNYRVHRFAWLYVHGEWPDKQIDHINGIKDDNRLANLRCVTAAENKQNLRRAMPANMTGLLGVSAKCGRFVARIEVEGKTITLGWFDTPEEAHEVYLQAKRRFHPMCSL